MDKEPMELIEKELEDLKAAVAEIKDTQAKYVREHHQLELKLLEMKGDIHYIKQSQDKLLGNLNKVLFIIGGGFITAAVAWIVGGGLSQ